LVVLEILVDTAQSKAIAVETETEILVAQAAVALQQSEQIQDLLSAEPVEPVRLVQLLELPLLAAAVVVVVTLLAVQLAQAAQAAVEQAAEMVWATAFQVQQILAAVVVARAKVQRAQVVQALSFLNMLTPAQLQLVLD
jgi:hypothetical protein